MLYYSLACKDHMEKSKFSLYEKNLFYINWEGILMWIHVQMSWKTFE